MAITGSELGGKSKAKAKASESKVTESSQAAEVVASEIVEDNPNLQRLSPGLAFVANLGDPSIDDTNTITNPDGTQSKDKKPRVVGYRFTNVGTEPISWVEFGLSEDWKRGDRMNYDKSNPGTPKVLAPGETADMTVYEAAMLFATVEINGQAAGGDYPVQGMFTETKKKSGSSVEDAGTGTEFSFRLGPATGQQFTTRDLPYENILTFDAVDKGDGRRMRTNRAIVPGFEKFAVMATTARAGRRGGSSTRANTVKRNQNAARFLEEALSQARAAK